MGFDGISLLEVYHLVYLGDEIEPEKQLGMIRMEFDSGSKKLYYQGGIDMSKTSIEYGDPIFVTDTGPICSLEQLDMQFDLFCGAYKGSIKVDFEPFQNRVWFEKHGIKSVDGTGEIRVVFGLLSNATVAKLEIQLLNISGATNVHGVIAARNSKLDQPYCTLFCRSFSNKIQVGRDEVIPLYKSRVGVPLDSRFYVDISLNIDDEQYIGTAYFDPLVTGEKFVEVDIPEKRTKIRVKVTWKSNEDSVCRTYDFVYREWDDDDEYDSDEDTE